MKLMAAEVYFSIKETGLYGGQYDFYFVQVIGDKVYYLQPNSKTCVLEAIEFEDGHPEGSEKGPKPVFILKKPVGAKRFLQAISDELQRLGISPYEKQDAIHYRTLAEERKSEIEWLRRFAELTARVRNDNTS